jgi:phage tail sheath protein FI
LSNADEFDFNLITTPGINHDDHSYVTGLTVDMCERRGDAFYIMDISHNQLAGDSSIQNVVDLAAQFDSNYVATYYPWVKVSETNSNKIMAVPPSVVMMGVYAANDKVAAEWFAPAGLNRGGIPTAVQVADRLTHTERDTLYEGKVNPVAAFPGQGIVAWGQ